MVPIMRLKQKASEFISSNGNPKAEVFPRYETDEIRVLMNNE